MDTWELVDAQRRDNVAMLERLTPEQWDTPSLCEGWRVRDVAAHMSLPASVNPLRFMGLLVRNGLNFNKAVAADGVQQGTEDTGAIVERYRRTIGSRKHPPPTKPVTVLNDMVVHSQDISRALGLGQPVPEERVRPALDFAKKLGFPIGAKQRVAGLRLVATDMDWTSGDGPEVRGPGLSLLMMINGRPDALADLEGPGKETLAARMS